MGARGDGRIPFRGPSASAFPSLWEERDFKPKKGFPRSAVEVDVDEGWSFEQPSGC